MKKYLYVFYNYLKTKTEYRADLLGIIAVQFLGILGVMILWNSVYSTNSQIGGYDKTQAIGYYLLIPLVGFFTVVEVSSKIGEEIKNGIFSNYLIRPYNIFIVSVVRAVSDRIDSLIIAVPLYSIFLAVYSSLVGVSMVNFSSILLFLVIVPFCFCLSFAIDITISWLGFWLTDIWSFRHFKYFVFYLLGGVNFPLEFLPGKMKDIFEFLPFKYLYYVPTSYLNGRRLSQNIFPDIAASLAWMIFFGALCFILWKSGIKKYESVGN